MPEVGRNSLEQKNAHFMLRGLTKTHQQQSQREIIPWEADVASLQALEIVRMTHCGVLETVRPTRSQSYDFGIYNYNASVVVGKSVFNPIKIFILKTRQAISCVVLFITLAL
jgi:hypothetical protein